MADSIDTLRDWASSLPPFDGEMPNVALVLHTENWTLYFAEWSGGKAMVKHFAGDVQRGPLSLALRGADERARSEIEGLRAFAPHGIAPVLLWEGEAPASMGGHMVIYRWVDGQLVGRRKLLNTEVDRYAGLLYSVHSEPLAVSAVAPVPANLADWWNQAHAAYRELPSDLLTDLPQSLHEALGRLTQAVSADAQAHKRFWTGVAHVPIHGSPVTHNLIFRGDGDVLVDWHRFGIGDPSYEIARVSNMLAPFAGWEAADLLVARYLERASNDNLRKRVEVYRRVWTFGRIVFLLSSAWNVSRGTGRQGTPATTLLYWSTILAFRLRSALITYGWTPEDAEKVATAGQTWLAGLPQMLERHVGRSR
jgi:aminoglycoside phosphotransferase (APT) family kinase protein